jgi:forkhead box protein K
LFPEWVDPSLSSTLTKSRLTMSPIAIAALGSQMDNIDVLHSFTSPDDSTAKISAYYSLVFPNITFYLQTLTVTIGRRCIPNASTSSSDSSPVDVDLGPLKSVSRLHAKIEYEEEEERFVLLVVGRNGAWVDGVWSGSGSRVPLGERYILCPS